MRVLVMLLALLPVVALAAIPVDTARLGEGVRVWYSSSANVPVVHASLSFEGAGSISDPAARSGRAALAAAMLSEGAGDRDSLAFHRALEDKAIEIRFDATDDRLRVDIHCLREHAQAAGELLAQALTAPRFAEDDLARVRTQTVSYLARLEESPNFQAQRAFEQTAFASHPYAAPHQGTPESIAMIGVQDLRNYMATYVTRGNLLVAAAGDVDRSLLRDMFGELIEALPAGDAGPVPASAVQMQGGGQALDVAIDVPQSTILFAAPAVPRRDKRFYGLYMLNDILGGNGLTSRLAEGLRQKKGLVYGVDTALEERDGVTLLRGSLASRASSAAEARDAVKSLLETLRQRGVTTQECEDARTHVLGAFALQLDGSRSLAQILLMMRIHHLGEDYLETRQEKFAAVTCGELNGLAKEFLVPERFLFVTAGQQP